MNAAAEARLLWAALLGYVAAGLIAVASAWFRGRLERPFPFVMAGALVVHGAAIGVRWARLGQAPFVTLFDALSGSLFSLSLIYLVAWVGSSVLRPTATVAVPILFLLLAWLLVVDPAGGQLPPTYDTIWLWVHLGFGKLFLGALFVAVALAAALFARRAMPPLHARLPEDAGLVDLAYRFLALAFFFDGLMLISGAVWARDAWGSYWSWNPLEVWAFATWLATAFALHLRRSVRLSAAVRAALVVVVFVVAFLTFFGVPFVSDKPHQGIQ